MFRKCKNKYFIISSVISKQMVSYDFVFCNNSKAKVLPFQATTNNTKIERDSSQQFQKEIEMYIFCYINEFLIYIFWYFNELQIKTKNNKITGCDEPLTIIHNKIFCKLFTSILLRKNNIIIGLISYWKSNLK
jgi:hypothetical protein